MRLTSCKADLFDPATSAERPRHARAGGGGARSHCLRPEPGRSVGSDGTDINTSGAGTRAESTTASGEAECSFALLRSTGDFTTRWDTARAAAAGRLTGDLPTRCETASLRVRGEPGLFRVAFRGLATILDCGEAALVFAPFIVVLAATLGIATRPSPWLSH